jgi:AraC-like DNA-binding protein
MHGATCQLGKARLVSCMAVGLSKSTWIYLPGDGGLTECARWQGERSARLAPHMHDDTQVCVVQTGRRRFATPFGVVEAHAGETIVIGAGVPHQALELGETTLALNFYFKAFAPSWDVTVVATPPCWFGCKGLSDHTAIANWLETRPAKLDLLANERRAFADLVRCHKPIALLAGELGMARESFSRCFRRLLGVSPQVFRVNAKLNIARSALRAGAQPADAAADAAFADQSHLGRAFRMAFGTTPAAYRRVFET